MHAEPVKKSDRTQSEIVECAYRLFLQKGYHGTSMRRIAAEVGIALGGIYNHFSSKEEIFKAVLLAHHPYYDLMPALMASRGETFEELIRDATRLMIDNLDDRLDFINLLFIELVEFNASHIPELFSSIFPEVLKFAERLIQRSANLKPIPIPILVRAFIGLFFSYLMTEVLIGRQLPPEWRENALDYFVDIYLHGVVAG